MPMQPSPIADTSGPFFPSLRVFIYKLLCGPPKRMRSALVLILAHLLHPVGAFAVKLFNDSDVRHGRRGGGAMPLSLARWKPDHVAQPNFFLGTTPALYPSATRCNDQCLTQRMGMPSGAGARFERHACAKNTRRCCCLEQ